MVPRVMASTVRRMQYAPAMAVTGVLISLFGALVFTRIDVIRQQHFGWLLVALLLTALVSSLVQLVSKWRHIALNLTTIVVSALCLVFLIPALVIFRH